MTLHYIRVNNRYRVLKYAVEFHIAYGISHHKNFSLLSDFFKNPCLSCKQNMIQSGLYVMKRSPLEKCLEQFRWEPDVLSV